MGKTTGLIELTVDKTIRHVTQMRETMKAIKENNIFKFLATSKEKLHMIRLRNPWGVEEAQRDPDAAVDRISGTVSEWVRSHPIL